MSAKPALAAVLLAAAAAAAAPDDAQALTCYVVLDRNDNVTYRDVYPPVDLSDAGRAERDAMRRRGEYLLFLEAEQCPRIEYFTGNAGTIGVALDQTLAPSQAPREPAPAASAPTAAQPRTARKPAAPKR
jgi:hypothetical protein